jgi:hypothetical protein
MPLAISILFLFVGFLESCVRRDALDDWNIWNVFPADSPYNSNPEKENLNDETLSELQSIHFQVLTELGVESVVTFGKPAREFYRNHSLGPKVLVNNDCLHLSIFTSKTRFATPDDCAKLDKMLSLILDGPSNIGASLFEENGVGWKIRQDKRALTQFGGILESQKQRNLRNPSHPDNILFGGPNESQKQLKARLWNIDPVNPKNTLFGGPNVSQKQVQRSMGGTDMTQSQKDVQFGGSEVSDFQLQKRELHGFGESLMTERQKDAAFGSGKETAKIPNSRW